MSRATAYEVVADLAPLGGRPVFAVRYAWGVRGSPHVREEPLCCASLNDRRVGITVPCKPASCPIMATGGLPANPFLAQIVDGRCHCIRPQQCDESVDGP